MNVDDIRHHAEEIRAILERHHLCSPCLFGSRARGEHQPDSDIDILVTPTEDCSLLDMIAAKHELAERFGLEFDLISTRAIHPLLSDNISTEAQPL